MLNGEFFQGTTPCFQFELPVSIEDIIGMRIVMSQKNEKILVKDFSECEVNLDTNTIDLKLTQEETFLFKEHKGLVELTVRVLLADDTAMTSDEIYLKVHNSSDKTVMY